MRTCRLCHFDAQPDDAVLTLPSGACICLRCYSRETGSIVTMPKTLQLEIDAILALAEAAAAVADDSL